MVVAGLVLFIASLPAAAQAPPTTGPEPPTSPPGATIDISRLEDACRSMAGSDREVCLFVVQTYLDPAGSAEEGSAPVYGVGDSQRRPNAEITLEKMDWDFKPPRTLRVNTDRCRWAFPCFPARNKSVAALIRMKCDEPEDSSVHQWKAMDEHGFTYMNAHWQKDIFNRRGKAIQTGQCNAEQDAHFWITFYVPKASRWLRIVENPFTEDALYWTVGRRR